AATTEGHSNLPPRPADETPECPVTSGLSTAETAMFKSLAALFSNDLAIDLGTANTLVYARNKGLVCSEPGVVTVATDHKGRGERVLAVGSEAKAMLGRTPSGIRAVRPIKDGVI